MEQCSCIKQRCWCQTIFFSPLRENKSVIMQTKKPKTSLFTEVLLPHSSSSWLQSFRNFCRKLNLIMRSLISTLGKNWSTNEIFNENIRFGWILDMHNSMDIRFHLMHHKNILEELQRNGEETSLTGTVLY